MMADEDENHRKRVAILGVRGVPAAHGGFETFAARFALHLVSAGWDVSVYCQEDHSAAPAAGQAVWHSIWEGVTRVHIAVGPDTPFNSIRFDWACVAHAARQRPDVVLILGYNTAAFALRLRLKGIPTVINMDGIEWRRAKWSAVAKAWLYANDWAGCLVARHLIADHPQIERHLRTRVPANKITVIPYGTDLLEPSTEDAAVLRGLGLRSGGFATLIARPEPENSILEMVQAFSAKPRGIKLVILGNYQPTLVDYHAKVIAAAGTEVVFLGAIYDKPVLQALRRRCMFYLHGHRVGGCNPSLLEAMGAGNAVLAHDNRFNRWVVREGAVYFSDRRSCENALDEVLHRPAQLAVLGDAGLRRARDVFHWQGILQSYCALLTDLCARTAGDQAGNRRAYWRIESEADYDTGAP